MPRLDEPQHLPPRKLLTMRDLTERFNVGRKTIMRMLADAAFPPPVRTSSKRLGWRPEDIDRWEAAGGFPPRGTRKKPPK